MKNMSAFSFKQLFAFFTLLALATLIAGALSAWTGPTATPPDGNVSAPLNVGTTDQVKDGGLGVDSLAVFGNTILSGTGGSYLNFGSSAGSGGYGIRDNGGALEFKNSGGSWQTTQVIVSALTSGLTSTWDLNGSSAYYNDGNVGIGTTNPAQQLHISRNSGGDATRLRLTETGSGYTWDVGVFGSNSYPGTFGIADMNAGQWRLSINSNGFVGIGTLAPNAILEIAPNPYGYSLMAPTIWASTYANAASYLIRGACWAGDCASDERLKSDVRPFEPGLDALLSINPVYYRWNGLGGKEKSDHDMLGVIAQDGEKGAPELISTEKVKLNPDDAAETEIKKVDYTGLPYIVVNAVKEFFARWSADSDEIHAQLGAQQAEINALKNEIEALKASR
jgi:hypothetical protein